jgi:hypothetical protein
MIIGAISSHGLSSRRAFGSVTTLDAAQWDIQNSNVSVNLQDLAYGNGLFLTGGSGRTLIKSSDGIDWTTVNSNFGSTIQITAIGYGNGIFVAGGQDPSSQYTEMRKSTNAINWTTISSSTLSYHRTIKYSNGVWFAGGYGGLRTSTDATTWVTRNTFGLDPVWRVDYGNGFWLIAGRDGFIRRSTDSINWVTNSSPRRAFAARILSYISDEDIWFLSIEDRTFTSKDGTNWTNAATLNDTAVDLGYNDGVYVLVTNIDIRTSNNLLSWTIRDPKMNRPRRVAYGNDLWAAIGYYGNISTSSSKS